MRKYDLVVVSKSSLKDDERKSLIESIKKLLTGIKVAEEEEWGQKPLAYTIKKEFSGFYNLFKLETVSNPSTGSGLSAAGASADGAEGTIPAGFEQKLLTNEKILRHLLLRTK